MPDQQIPDDLPAGSENLPADAPRYLKLLAEAKRLEHADPDRAAAYVAAAEAERGATPTTTEPTDLPTDDDAK